MLSRNEYCNAKGMPYEIYVERYKRKHGQQQKERMERRQRKYENRWEKEDEYSIFCENRLNTIKQDILLGEIKTFNNPLYHQN